MNDDKELIALTAGLEACGERPATQTEIAARLRLLAYEMDDIAACMDYYGGFAKWAQRGREVAGGGNIARQWAAEIDAANAPLQAAPRSGVEPGSAS